MFLQFSLCLNVTKNYNQIICLTTTSSSNNYYTGSDVQVTAQRERETGNIDETLDDINQWGGGNGNTYYVVAYESIQLTTNHLELKIVRKKSRDGKYFLSSISCLRIEL